MTSCLFWLEAALPFATNSFNVNGSEITVEDSKPRKLPIPSEDVEIKLNLTFNGTRGDLIDTL